MNCFHFSVSLGYKTTTNFSIQVFLRLWIAFIFQYLWDTKQLGNLYYINTYSCELLSFFSIFGIQNNKNKKIWVILTTATLWIAFIFQYLWDTKQHAVCVSVVRFSCELLSFFSIFGIQNNLKWLANFKYTVVNCFHFSVSLGYKTTNRHQWAWEF